MMASKHGLTGSSLVSALLPVYHREIPPVLAVLAQTPPLLRLREVGMNCGCEYTRFPDVYKRQRQFGCCSFKKQGRTHRYGPQPVMENTGLSKNCRGKDAQPFAGNRCASSRSNSCSALG